MLTANDIRKKFLDFFASKGHKIITSDSLVPKDDPTVLFTTAGMQQFKRQFLGNLDDFTRAATSQKCLRTDDLDQVGKTNFHHTFFEMLGNFSFGDYFKPEAIAWAWEFLTQVLQIPKEKLWVSIYKDDSEAEAIWLNHIKIPAEHFVKLGDKSNFWPSNAKTAGPNGPCGPCSEIFFDYGFNPNCTNSNCNPDCDCGRFSEIWNLVFTQFNRKDGGVLEPLPAKNIDTGMGLERLTAVMQGKHNNYETDLFAPIRESIRQNIFNANDPLTHSEECQLSDHIRAIVFAINDGIIPSNKERGSVIKRLINDSVNIALTHGKTSACVYQFVPAVVIAMQSAYPEISAKAKDIAELIHKTEEAFISVRNIRIPELENLNLLPMSSEERGEIYFKFRDTYGLPLSTIKSTVLKKGLSKTQLDDDLFHYNRLMTEQQERSRQNSKMMGDVFTNTGLNLDVPKTNFLGYQHTEHPVHLLKIYADDLEVTQASAGQTVKCVLDCTPFYAEAGGQVGDLGLLIGPQGTIKVTGTQKIADIYLHTGIIESGRVAINDPLNAQVDLSRRFSIMRNHSATHLLQAALRKVLGEHVQQQGSLVDEDKLRFDFTHPKALTEKELIAVEAFVNQGILDCTEIKKTVMSIEEAKANGALAFFAEKYGETVRVVEITGYSKELCGGTHCDSTGQIGLFKITGESAIAQGIRRIEARTGVGALKFINEKQDKLKNLSAILKAPEEELVDRVNSLTQTVKQLQKELEQYQFNAIKDSLAELIESATAIGDSKIILHMFENIEVPILRSVADLIKQKQNSVAVVLATKSKTGTNILCTISDDLIKRGVSAETIVRELAAKLGGSGGGRASMAQAGSKSSDSLGSAMQLAKELLVKSLNG